MKKYLIGIWLLAAFLCVPAGAWAGPPTDYVKRIMQKVMAIQNDPALAGPAHQDARARAIRQIIKENFDFPMMARDSLGPTYQRLSGAQAREFEQTFASLFQDSYTRLVLNFLKQETIQYHQESQQGDRAQVKTTIVRINETIPVEYLMHSRSRSWVLYDVKVDGVSILKTYKDQFARVIRSKSFPFLLNRMKMQAQAID
ncbi:MAG: ABC transporter substrate-binding protein [Deltaproteobacteria bacterium]|nr:ABC transporter substrate-binding protein [Deltaproteobacteria bacterium]MBW2134244.1 ABC transporter substrate-binding protein [Deltaproteobacteria bacterium]